MGAIGSFCNCNGLFFAVSAISTNEAAGPMTALFSSQMIIVTVVEAILSKQIP
jgi:hypothetical protein